MRAVFAQIANPAQVHLGAPGCTACSGMVLHTMLDARSAPIAGVCVAGGVLANVAQVGFRPSLTALKPDFKRINPVPGFKNVFGTADRASRRPRRWPRWPSSAAVAAMTLVPLITHLGAGVGTTPIGARRPARAPAPWRSSSASSSPTSLIAIVDLIWQRRRHAKELKMTKQEVKEEHKQTAAAARGQERDLRRRQMQAARARMMAAVPTADVVVTNPTHYAVALSYDGTKPAPVVVAKGKNLVAAQIRRIADENDVPIVPDPPLARSLHAAVEIDQMIPAELYAAVAQVLAFVYKMAGRRRVAA